MMHKEMETVKERMDNFDQYKDDKLKQINDILKESQVKFKAVDDEIEAAKANTSIHDSNIPQFIELLTTITDKLRANEERNLELIAKTSGFMQMLKRDFEYRITIESYFGNDRTLGQYTEILHKEEFYYMDDLRCDNKEEFQKILDLILSTLQVQCIPKSDERKLKKICLRSHIWKSKQTEKEEQVIGSMKNVSPILIDFLAKFSIQIPKSQQYTAFQAKLNQSQYKLLNKHAVNKKQKNEYLPSLSTGIYGSYVIQKIEAKDDEAQIATTTTIDGIAEDCRKLCEAATKFVQINDYKEDMDYQCKDNNSNWKKNAKLLTQCFQEEYTSIIELQLSMRNVIILTKLLSNMNSKVNENENDKSKQLWIAIENICNESEKLSQDLQNMIMYMLNIFVNLKRNLRH